VTTNLKEGKNNLIITNVGGAAMYIDQIIYTPAGIEAEKFQVTLREAEGGSVSADVTEAAEGQKVQLNVTPAEGYAHVGWEIIHGNVTIGDDNSFVMPDDIVTLQPLFADQTEAKPVNYIHIPNLPKCDGAIYVVGDSMYPLLKSGDIVLYKQLSDVRDVFWGDMYLLSIDIDGEEYITVKYVQKSDHEGYVKLVSQNQHHADKEVEISRIRAIALIKASIRMHTIG